MGHLSPSSVSRKFSGRNLLTSAVAAAALMASVGQASATVFDWSNTAAATTNWGTGSNWVGGVAPIPGAGDTVNFNTALLGAETIAVYNTGDPDIASKTFGILNIGTSSGAFKYTLSAGTGSGALSLDNGGAGAQINQVATSAGDTISAPIVMADANVTTALTITNAATANALTLTGGITSVPTGANLVFAANGTGGITTTTTSINNKGTITNSGGGTGTTTLSAVGNNVTAVTQSSTTSALTITTLAVNSGGTTLTNTLGTKILTATTVNGTGNLILANNSALAAGITLTTISNVGSVTNQGVGNGSVTTSGIVSVNGGVTQDSATSILSLNTVGNTYTGGTFIKRGTISSNSNFNTPFGNAAHAITIGDNTRNENATLLYTGAGTIANPITIASVSAGTLSINGSGNASTFTGPITLNNALTVAFLTANKITLGGQITGSSTITAGSTNVGTVSLTGSNGASFTGAVNLNAGTLSFTNAALGNGSGAINFGGGFLQYAVGNLQDIQSRIADTGSAVKLDVNSNAITLASPIGAGKTGGLTVISTTVGGSLTLTGTQLYSGTTTIGTATANTGKLILAPSASLATGAAVSTLAGGTLDLNGNSQTFGILNNLGVITNTGGGTPTLVIGSGSVGTTGSFTGPMNLTTTASTSTAVAAGIVNVTGVIVNNGSGTGTGTTTITSVGTNVTSITEASLTSALTITTLNVNAGGTTITNTLGTKVLTVTTVGAATGNLTIENKSPTAAAITLVTVNNVGTVTNSVLSTASVTMTGVIGTNVLGVIQDSVAGTLALSGANTLTNNVTIKQGTLSGSNAVTPFGSGAGTIILGDNVRNANATLLTTSTSLTIANPITITAVSSGTLTINGQTNTQTFTGPIALNNAVTLANLTAAKITTFAGQITGSSTVTIGSGNLGVVALTNVNNASTFSGPITLNAGTLSFTTGGLGLGGITLGGNSTVQWGTATTTGAVITNAGVFVGTLDVGANNANLSAANSLTGPSTSFFTKLAASAGTLTISNANSFSGTYTASTTGGTTILSHANALQNAIVAPATTAATGGITFDSAAGGSFTVGALTGSGNLGLKDNAGTPAPVALTLGSNGLTTTYSGILSSTGSLIKNGTTTQTLSGPSTFSGGVAINNGVLIAGLAGVAGVSGPLGIGATSVNAGGELRVNVTSGLLGSSSIILNGGTLRGLNAATIVYGGNTSVTSNSTIINDKSGTANNTSANYTFGTLAIGSSTLNVTSTTNYTGGTATVTFGAATFTGDPTFNVTNNGATNATALVLGDLTTAAGTQTITLTGNGAMTLGALSGTRNFTFNIASTSPGLTLTNVSPNNYVGVTTINTGILSIASLADQGTNSGIGQGSGVPAANSASDLVFGGGTLRMTGAAAGSTDRLFTVGDASGSSATLEDNSTHATLPGMNFTNAGAIVFGTAGTHTLGFGGSHTIANTFSPSFGNSDGLTSNPANATSVTKSGASTWILGGTTSYTGTTTISGGVLQTSQNEGFGPGLVTITAGQAAVLGTTYSNDWNIAGTINAPATTLSGLITLSGNSTFINPTDLTTTVISGRMTGSAGITFQGNASRNATWRISNPLNDYAGDTNLTFNSTSGKGNSLILDANEVIPNGPGKGNLVLSITSEATGVNVQLNGHTETINGLSSNVPTRASGNAAAHVVQNSSATPGTLIVGDNNASATYIGTLQNGGGGGVLNLIKKDSGTQVLSGASAHTGTTTVTGGTLAIDFTIFGTSLTSSPINYFSTVSDVILDGSTTLAITGRGNGGTIVAQSGIAIASASRSFVLPNVEAAKLVVGQALTFSNNIGGLPTYTGAWVTAIDAPGATTTQVWANQRLANNAGATTATLDTAPTTGLTTQTFKSLTLTGSANLQADGGQVIVNTTSGVTSTGASPVVLTLRGSGTANNTLTGAISNGSAGIGLTKSGTSVWVLSNDSNAYTGITTITAGTLKLAPASGNNNIPSSSSIIVGDSLANNAAQLDVTGVAAGFILSATQTLGGHGTVIGNVATSSGAAIAPGNSIGTITFQSNLDLVDGTVLNYDLDAPGNSDLTAVQNTLNIAATPASIHVNLSDMGAMGEGVYTLFTYQNLTGGDVEDAFVVDSSPLTNVTYTFSSTGASNGQILLEITPGAPIPEPTSLAMLGLGAVILLRRRR